MVKKRIMSFKYAGEGLKIAFTEQPNLIIHLFAALLALVLGWYYQVSELEWLFIILISGLVISIELTNTAIEEVVDSFTTEAHPAAKKAKDVAAGAVLIASITAIIIGLRIFLPYILSSL